MSAVTASLCSILFFVGGSVFVFADQKTITAESGQDVTLPCRAPNNKIIVVKWSRTDLEDEHVLLYHDGHFDPDNQHPSFKNRVDLQDRQMKDGDVSLILKDVTYDDTGTYVCSVFMSETRSWELSIIIYLRVVPDQKTIPAEPGQDITLPCRGTHNNISILLLEWSRDDLESEHVFVYRDGQRIDQQHPSFANRVHLQDRQMKHGDVSLILKNVTIKDTGKYVCRVNQERTNRRKRANLDGDPISIVYLSVDHPGHTGGHTEDGSVGLLIVLSVSSVLVLVLVVVLVVVTVFLNYKKRKQQSLSLKLPEQKKPLSSVHST